MGTCMPSDCRNGRPSLTEPSFPNHLFTVAGASGPDDPDSATGNPKHTTASNGWRCDSASAATVRLRNGTNIYPCFSFPTLADEIKRPDSPLLSLATSFAV